MIVKAILLAVACLAVWLYRLAKEDKRQERFGV